ncbi:MAG TPA: folylpolyglutamate synthase/dihydrofolate synthase family protein [Streptosporangiaceae bacterium]|nr:folylpolyglutamate synthase/dihydrofolate synthase family protein [Streptosporangiaceae bacterium]
MTDDARTELAAIERDIAARRPEHAIEPSLDRIIALTSLLGDPQRAYPIVHITGTNGKTSTARMTETLLRVRGLRTGLFTSPHLVSMRERICIDGQPLAADRFIEVYRELEPYLKLVDEDQQVPLSFFEVLTAMGFAAFADAPVDVAVIEVGMGGTWDNTNVADGVVAIVTPISIDHAKYLGDTVAKIAADKAGIIKPGAVAVLGQQPVDAAAALIRRAVKVGASVAREGIEFGVLSRELAVGGQRLSLKGLLGEYHDLFLPLFGAHQAGNAACALAAVEAFSGASGSPDALLLGSDLDGDDDSDGDDGADGSADFADMGLEPANGDGLRPGPVRAGSVALDDDIVRTAFATVSSPGRLEIVRRSPVVVIDAAHNPAGMAVTMTAMAEAFGPAEIIAVIAAMADKDVAGILAELEPFVAGIVVTTNSSPRSMPAAELGQLAASLFGADRVHEAGRLDDAIELAVGLADEASDALGGPLAGLVEDGATSPLAAAGTVVLITGSVYTAGEARLLLRGEE